MSNMSIPMCVGWTEARMCSECSGRKGILVCAVDDMRARLVGGDVSGEK